MIKALALDISKTRTGWAVGTADSAPPSWGVFETVDWKNNEGLNLAAFRRLLRSFQGVTHIVFEEIFVNVGKHAAFNFNGTQGQMFLEAAMLLHCHDEKITPFEINISDWRKRFLGINVRPKDAKGDDGYWKRLAIKAAAERNWYVEHHDSAEALGIMDFALSALDKDYKLATNPIHGRRFQDYSVKRGAHA